MSELLIFRHLSLKPGKGALLILPFVSVVSEKEASLKRIAEAAGMSVRGFHHGSRSSVEDDFSIAVCTIEKVWAPVLFSFTDPLLYSPTSC